MEPGLGMLWERQFQEHSMFKSMMNRLLCQSVGNGNGTIEGNTTKRFSTLPGILDEKKKRRVSYDLCS